MVPRNSSLRAHPADTSTGCAVCVLSSFQRTRPFMRPQAFRPSLPSPQRRSYCRLGRRQGNLTILLPAPVAVNLVRPCFPRVLTSVSLGSQHETALGCHGGLLG